MLTYSTLAAIRTTTILLILIETDHLVKNLLGDRVDRSELEWRNGNLHIRKSSDDRLDLGVIDAIQRLNDHQIVLLLRIFHDRCLDRSEVLLVGQIDVVEQRAFAGEESTGELQ